MRTLTVNAMAKIWVFRQARADRIVRHIWPLRRMRGFAKPLEATFRAEGKYEPRLGRVRDDREGTTHYRLAEELAGAVGLEPTPSSLTVRCPTNWTTPQRACNVGMNPSKIVVVSKTRKPATEKYYSVFSVGKPASVQERQPPSMEMQFLYPIFAKLSAASAERKPPPQ